MAVTPDRFPGTREEDEIVLVDQGSSEIPSVPGAMLRAGDDILMRDVTGTFNPRSGGSRVGLLVFKIDGGLVYNFAGEPLLKVNE